MSKILLLKGLPASGKSTFAKELARQSDWKRVNKDDIRAMADDSKWSKANEKLVIEWRDMLIWNSLANGYSVVVDDTNLHPKHLERMHQIAREFSGNKVEVEEKFFDVSVEECIKRDLGRNNSVGEKVIRTMYNQFVNSSQAPYVAPLEATDAIIVDIDGTLAHMNDRSPYDASKYSEDTADPTIVEMVNLYRDYFGDELSVIICSGRDDTYQLETEEWLVRHGVRYDEIHMRPGGDKRKDWIVKKELFDTHIRDKYNIRFVLDDRNQVVEMWRSLGLKCLQVADGNF